MNILLWVLQIGLGLFLLMTGFNHFTLPDNLPAQMAWMYDMPQWLHIVSGSAEILAGLGLILPAVTRVQTRLVPLAALGVVAIMAGAALFHLTRGEMQNIVMNLFLAAIAGFIWYGRSQLSPLRERGEPAV